MKKAQMHAATRLTKPLGRYPMVMSGGSKKRGGSKGEGGAGGSAALGRPVICLANDLYAPALRPLRDAARVINFRAPTQVRGKLARSWGAAIRVSRSLLPCPTFSCISAFVCHRKKRGH